MITSESKGIIFKDSYTEKDRYYTRLEYHRFVDQEYDGQKVQPYIVSNKAYVSKSSDSIGDPISLEKQVE